MIYDVQTWRLGVKADPGYAAQGQVTADSVTDAINLVMEHPNAKAGDVIALSEGDEVTGLISINWYGTTMLIVENPEYEAEPGDDDPSLCEDTIAMASHAMMMNHKLIGRAIH